MSWSESLGTAQNPTPGDLSRKDYSKARVRGARCTKARQCPALGGQRPSLLSPRAQMLPGALPLSQACLLLGPHQAGPALCPAFPPLPREMVSLPQPEERHKETMAIQHREGGRAAQSHTARKRQSPGCKSSLSRAEPSFYH